MAQRLALSLVGIKSPLEVGEETATPAALAATPAPAKSRAPRRRVPSTSSTTTAKVADAPPVPAKRGAGAAPFYGLGRPLQTSIALNAKHVDLLTELAKASGSSVNAIAVAAIHAGLPGSSDVAREAILEERVRRAGNATPRLERNLRLAEQLRARIDELTAGARERLPRSERADLINVALERGMPPDAQAAAELVVQHARRLELASGC